MGGCWNTPAYGYGGYGYGYSQGYGYRSAVGGVIDADPITPGIQSTPGVVTPVGPPRVVGGSPYPGISNFAPPVATYAPPIASTYQSTYAPVVTQPFVPPIVAPTIGTTIGGPGYIGGPGIGLGRPGFGLDLDPITPGRQVTPGVVTATGPSFVLGR